MHEVLQVKDRDLLCRKLLKDLSGQLQSNHDYHGISLCKYCENIQLHDH